MAIAPNLQASGRGVHGSAYLTAGMQSSTDPMFINDRAYVSSMNTVNRGGIVQSRPGYRCLFRLPDGNLQGCTYFKPLNSAPQLIFAVAGVVYVSPYPFVRYSALPGVQFYHAAPRMYWAVGTKSAVTNEDGTISVVDPVRTLIMQDGGFTRAAYWDGETSRHLDPSALETPLGGPMAWSGGRLWVAYKNQLIPSDIDNPLSFSEASILAINGIFFTGEDITGLAEIPGLATPQLACFTEVSTFVFQSGIRDRTTWSTQTAPPFQSVLFPEVGCVSHNSIVSQYGLLWWMTHTGLTNFNSAKQAFVSSTLSAQDVEMASSKGNISPNIIETCASYFENYMLVSVPSGDKRNRHTWVMDKTVIDDITDAGLPAWNSIWTGTNPKQWMRGPANGVMRIFHVSNDADGANRLWEAFTPDRLDNGLPITSYLETKTHIDFSPRATGLDLKQFLRAEVTFTEMYGDVSAAIFWAGTRGRYKKLAEYNFVATQGQLRAGESVNMNTVIRGYRPQTRVVRTPSINVPALIKSECTSCGVESNRSDSIDTGFSLLVVWSGRAAIRSYRIFADPEQEKSEGECTESETGETNIVVDALCTATFEG